MTFFIGLGIGIFIGANLGVVITAACFAGKHSDEEISNASEG